MKPNSNSSAGANADSSTKDELTTSAKLLPNPMLAAVSINMLVEEIMKFKRLNYGENPKNINLSITDGYELEAEIINTTGQYMNRNLHKFQFMGIRIIRSMDVDKGEIILNK
jgi:hypothetical protein